MNKGIKISYEVFPPKGENYENKVLNLLEELKELEQFDPYLISVTYGAGGSNRENSLDIVKRILNNLKTDVMPHFTCVCSSKDYIEEYIEEIKSLKIRNILALRGDEPKDINICHQDFKYAFELVQFLHQKTTLDIAVAGYPEKHPRAVNMQKDIENLKKKVDMGASTIYTQLFFDNNNFYDFINLCAKANIDVPIIAGILPVISFEGLLRMAYMSDVKLPPSFINKFENLKDDKMGLIEAGIEFAINQCQELIKNGVDGLHFYTLNKARSTKEILKNIL